MNRIQVRPNFQGVTARAKSRVRGKDLRRSVTGALERLEARELLAGVISGVVFEDYNANGTRDVAPTLPNADGGTVGVSVDRGLAGVVVTAYDPANAVQGTATTAADGTYSFAATGAGPYRVQFTSLPAGFNSGPQGPDSGSTVQFVPGAGATNVSLGLVQPGDYNTGNPTVATSIYQYGDPINGPNANAPGIVTFPYTAGGTTTSPAPTDPNATTLAVTSKVGTTFGLAYSPDGSTLYAGAFMKKHAGYGPGGTGAIYAVNSATGQVSVFADLNAIFGAGTAGANAHDTTNYNTDNGNTAWNAVGTSSLGGLAVSPDGSTVYVMNLANRTLYAIPTSGPINTTTVKSQQIPLNAPGATGTNGADEQPFAVTYYNGQLYVGIVNSAQTTQNAADLRAYVYTVNPATLAFSAAPVFQAPLNYTRAGQIFYGTTPLTPSAWNPWSPTYKNVGGKSQSGVQLQVYPQPELTGIAFDASGDMTLGLRDRGGDQAGSYTNDNPANPGQSLYGTSGGDTLQAFIITPNNPATGWTLESNARGPAGQGAGPQNNNFGPGGGQFFYQNNFPAGHDYTASGAVATLPGAPDVLVSAFDPAPPTFDAGGFIWDNVTTGGRDKAYQLYRTNPGSNTTFDKANGLGGVAIRPAVAPLEIGDRVFLDNTGDGLQDANDPGIAGVTVDLYQGSTLIATTVTDANGNYLFNATNVTGGLKPNTAYDVKLDNPADSTAGGPLNGLSITKANADPNGQIDSKAKDVGGFADVSVTTGSPGMNNHTLDFGFQPQLKIGMVCGFVYVDANNDGVFQPTETPIANVTLNLTGTSGAGAPVNFTTTTAADGSYCFTGVPPGDPNGYTITDVPPANYFPGKITPGTTGGTPGVETITMVPIMGGGTSNNNNFGKLPPAQICGTVYVDPNNNGTIDSTDKGLPNVTLTLTGTNDLGAAVTVTTMTAADGTYCFMNLRPSDPNGYTITETQPPNYVSGINTPGTLGGTVPPAPPDTISGIVPKFGDMGKNYNFAELPLAQICGFVYVDANNDGIKQAAETPIANVMLTLAGALPNGGGTYFLTTTTAADGSYCFMGLLPGTASIIETQPPGYVTGKNTPGSLGGTAPPPTADVIQQIPVAYGDTGVNYNFGELVPAQVCGFVYVDANNDGIKQAAETPIANVTLTLTGSDDAGNAVTLTTTTAADGSYCFMNLRPSNPAGYTVTETQPAAYLTGKNTPGTLGGTGSTPPVNTFTSIVVQPGNNGQNYNFGELTPAQVCGFVYVDANNDGIKQAAETPIANVTLTLTGTDDTGAAVTLTTTTAADGSYCFMNLRPSNPAGYTVTETQPAAYLTGKNTPGTLGGTGSTPPVNTFTSIVVQPGSNGQNYNFGELTPAQVCGYVYVDANNDGIKQAAETGIANVTLTLTGTDDTGAAVTLTTTTAADGSYCFTPLRPSNPAGYTVTETQPPAYLTGKNTPGSLGGTGSIPPTDTITSIVTPPGGSGMNYNFGELTPAQVCGYVYVDANNDGIKQAAETPIANVTLTLTGTDDTGKAVTLTTTTAADGSYCFMNLRPSSPTGYIVTETQPAAYLTGKNTPGTLGGTGSTPPTDTITSIVVQPGNNGQNYNFGELVPAQVCGYVYVDANNDGIKQATEAPLANVTLTLTGTDDTGKTVTLTTTTAADGSYCFMTLRPSDPSGYKLNVPTVPNYLPGKSTPGTIGGTPTAPPTSMISTIVTPPGGSGMNYNFGELVPAQVCGYVYVDANNDGIKQATETGIANVTLTLTGTDDNGATVTLTTTTAADGSYCFMTLRPSSPTGYTVIETQPPAYLSGKNTPGTLGGTGSTPPTDTITRIVVPPGGSGMNTNFGELVPAQVCGYVYVDANNDGIKQASETGIANITIMLTGTDDTGKAVSLTTTTAADGSYCFMTLRPSNPTGYTVTEMQPPNYLPGQNTPGTIGGTPSAPPTSVITTIVTPPGGSGMNYNFGEIPPGQVCGTIFTDLNNDGVQQPNEPGICCATITLTGNNSFGQAVSLTTTTANDGTYCFNNVPPSDPNGYTITEVPPPNTLPGKTTPGTNGGNPPTPTAYTIGTVVTHAGDIAKGYNFAALVPGQICGYSYVDANGNGLKDQGEAGIPGVTVILTGANDLGPIAPLTTTTDANGLFCFMNLRPGTYAALESAPPPGFLDGLKSTAGLVLGNSAGTLAIPNIVLAPGQQAALDNNFGTLTPPTVVSLQRFGVHTQPTQLVITFSQAMSAASAQTTSNYRLTGPGGRSIGIVSAVYNPATQSVTLRTSSRLDVHRTYLLTIASVANSNGVPMATSFTTRVSSTAVAGVLGSNGLFVPVQVGAAAPNGVAAVNHKRSTHARTVAHAHVKHS